MVVDAAQGVEAQTLANVYLAIGNDLEVVPVINKIDLPAAEPDKVKKKLKTLLDFLQKMPFFVPEKQGLELRMYWRLSFKSRSPL